MKNHCFCWILRSGHVACCRCGLVKLKNRTTQLAIKAPCKGQE